ncbi:MAG: hypothetical protein HONBIEJF_02168 [Fimbriimonadaceae bacterium]|nr:hypothetical protein [Fimbriimonadaceae bacterium]
MRNSIWLSFAACLACLGCGEPGIVADGKSADKPLVTFIAVDTSASARNYHSSLFSAAKSELGKVPSKEQVYVFRFDHDPAEVFSGPPPDQEKAPHVIRELMKHQTAKEGTNLARLLVRVDRAMTANSCRGRLVIFTDSGTELMTREEKDQVRSITRGWGEQGSVVEMRFVGVSGGQREALRDMIELPIERLKIE